MPVNGVTSPNGTTVPIVDKDKTGFNGLTSDTFLKLLITQLQNQDPTQPMGNEELLQQLSSMRSLQSNIELSDTLKQITNNQQLTAGSSLLGKLVIGKDEHQQDVAGIVDRVFVRDGVTIVGSGNSELPMKNVTGVSLTAG